MPGFDGTGPRGMGSMTGGGRGFCTMPLHSARPAYAGIGSQMPYATPWGVPYYGTPPFTPGISREEELDHLKGLAHSMRNNLEEIEARIQQVESKEE